MDLGDVKEILEDITYKNWRFVVNTKRSDGVYLQVKFDDVDIDTGNMGEQSGRKWYISPFSTKSEVIQTALKACLTAEEHECREKFKYKNTAIFGPHLNVDELVEFCKQTRLDRRAPLEEKK